MFTKEDLQSAFDAGIFSHTNDLLVPPATVIRFFEQWAKEQEKKIRHTAAEIAITIESKDVAH